MFIIIVSLKSKLYLVDFLFNFLEDLSFSFEVVTFCALSLLDLYVESR